MGVGEGSWWKDRPYNSRHFIYTCQLWTFFSLFIINDHGEAFDFDNRFDQIWFWTLWNVEYNVSNPKVWGSKAHICAILWGLQGVRFSLTIPKLFRSRRNLPWLSRIPTFAPNFAGLFCATLTQLYFSQWQQTCTRTVLLSGPVGQMNPEGPITLNI